jgi:hypothetical protein
MLVARDEEGRLYATSPSVAEPWACPASPSGHLIAVKSAAPAPRVFTWDYREQPPLGEILAKARAMPGPWFWFCPETGSQDYALILSDRALTADEADRILWERVEG